MPVLSLTGLALALSGALGGLAVLWAIPGTLLTGVAAGAAIALMATIGNLSGYVSPVLIGWISSIATICSSAGRSAIFRITEDGTPAARS